MRIGAKNVHPEKIMHVRLLFSIARLSAKARVHELWFCCECHLKTFLVKWSFLGLIPLLVGKQQNLLVPLLY